MAKMAENDGKWLEMAGIDTSCWKLLKMAVYGLKLLNGCKRL